MISMLYRNFSVQKLTPENLIWLHDNVINSEWALYRFLSEAHNQKPWTPVLGLVLMLPRMSVKQPHCLTMMSDLPTPASRAYLVTFELIDDKHMFERFFRNGMLHACYTCSNIYCIKHTMDCFSPKQHGTLLIQTWNHSNDWLLNWHPEQPKNQPWEWSSRLLVMGFCSYKILLISQYFLHLEHYSYW